MTDEFRPKAATSTHTLSGSFTCRKYATWDKRLYFPSEGMRAEDFFFRYPSSRVWTRELGYQSRLSLTVLPCVFVTIWRTCSESTVVVCTQCVVIAVFSAVCERYVRVTSAATLFRNAFLFRFQRKCITHSVSFACSVSWLLTVRATGNWVVPTEVGHTFHIVRQ